MRANDYFVNQLTDMARHRRCEAIRQSQGIVTVYLNGSEHKIDRQCLGN